MTVAGPAAAAGRMPPAPKRSFGSGTGWAAAGSVGRPGAGAENPPPAGGVAVGAGAAPPKEEPTGRASATVGNGGGAAVAVVDRLNTSTRCVARFSLAASFAADG